VNCANAKRWYASADKFHEGEVMMLNDDDLVTSGSPDTEGPADAGAGGQVDPNEQDGGADGGAEGPADAGAGETAVPAAYDGGADGGAGGEGPADAGAGQPGESGKDDGGADGGA
jgi:hypothetical protein